MNIKRHFGCMLRAGLLVTGASLALVAPAARAQGFPEKPLRIIVGAPVGGSTDFIARLLAEGLTPLLGKPVVVDNKPGAGGGIALQEMLNAPHDGHTLNVSAQFMVSEIPHTTKPKYDTLKDIKPLAELARTSLVLVGHPSLPAKTVKELVAHVKAHPGKISFASFSAGSLSHIMGLQLNQAAGLDMKHIGYRGSPPALLDVTAGHVAMMFDGIPTSLPFIKAGKLKAYAVGAPRRSSVLPDVPTMAELGFPQIEGPVWFGLFIASDVPAAAQQKLREASLKVLQQPHVRERLMAIGIETGGQPPTSEELSAWLRKEFNRVGDLLHSINYKPE